ncbi:hypothetical protein HY632_02840 [Candidatus Uhrbacteria bacterium]|nr:hypothetical protein [Candidatus Uhrbacteria bacterium]
MSERTEAARRHADTIWKAGILRVHRFVASGMIPPTDTCPEAEIWSATVHEIIAYSNDRDLLARWDRASLEQRYTMFEGRKLGYDHFIACYNAEVHAMIVQSLQSTRQ